MRYVTTIVRQVGVMGGLERWLTLLSVILSGPTLAVGASGIGVIKLADGSTIPSQTLHAGEYWVSPSGDEGDRGPRIGRSRRSNAA